MLSDKKLLEGLLAQDPAAIRELYKRLEPAARSLILKMGGQHADADDILQESIIALYVNLRKNQYQQHAGVKLTSYVLQIARYQWLNHQAKAARQRERLTNELPEEAELPDLQTDMHHLERNQKVRHAILQLPARCQQMLNLFYWEKKSIKEIADTFKISPDSAKNAKYRCMQRIKDLLHSDLQVE